jgi:hypothetical protein
MTDRRDTASAINEAAVRRAFELRRKTARARRLADMAVAIAMDEERIRRRDPHEKPLQFAHDVAIVATTILIDQIYNDDRELAALRSELEAYRERALAFANMSAPPMVIIPPIALKRDREDGQ